LIISTGHQTSSENPLVLTNPFCTTNRQTCLGLPKELSANPEEMQEQAELNSKTNNINNRLETLNT